jgi:hypothetical protein
VRRGPSRVSHISCKPPCETFAPRGFRWIHLLAHTVARGDVGGQQILTFTRVGGRAPASRRISIRIECLEGTSQDFDFVNAGPPLWNGCRFLSGLAGCNLSNTCLQSRLPSPRSRMNCDRSSANGPTNADLGPNRLTPSALRPSGHEDYPWGLRGQ